MAENKTRENDSSVTAFLSGVENETRREDAFAILSLMEDVTGLKAKMWGTAIIGFGSYHYKYDTGREGDAPLIAFSPRKQNLVLYLSSDFDRYDELISKLGKHKTGKVCLYLNKLTDVNQDVLRELVKESFEYEKDAAHDKE